jgi:hypothetical protein
MVSYPLVVACTQEPATVRVRKEIGHGLRSRLLPDLKSDQRRW